MKRIITLLLIACVITINVSAQTVTINFKGITANTKNYLLKIDQANYYSNDNNGSSTVTINNLSLGKHSLYLYSLRNGNPSNNSRFKNPLVYTRAFELRSGYDMEITVRPNGRVLFSEKIAKVAIPVSVRTPMTSVKFNQLVLNVRNKWSQALKGETVSDAFADTANYFTTTQVRQLLTMITNESDRVDLAKLSYSRVTNVGDFMQLFDLFKTQSSIDELNSFLSSNGWKLDNNSQVGIRTPMTDANFNVVLQSVKSKWSQSLKGETASEAFRKQNNYFTTAQVRQVLQLISAENDRVDLAMLAYPAITDTSNFTTLYSLLNNQSSREELNNYLRSRGWTFPGDVAVRTVMTTTNFNTLLQSVRNKWSQSLKGETINDAFRNTSNYFNVAQVNQLLMQITSESDKLELAKLSYNSIADTANFTQLFSLFPTQSYKDALNSFLRERGWNIGLDVQGNVKTPMSSANFDQLVQNIRGNLLQILKVASLKNVFRDPANYFTSDQAYQLIALINAEDNRLELAKLAYRSVVDRNNYTVINSLLLTQASKDDLTRYIREYRE